VTLLAIAAGVAGCAADETDAGTDAGADVGADAEVPSGPVFTHKMMMPTGENPFAAVGYECPQCTFEQWLDIETPEGWTKGPAQVLLADSGELRSRPSFEGIPDAMDFVEEVPGEEYELIVKNLDAQPIEATADGVIVQAHVLRDNELRFEAGRRVHELTDPEGNVFVLFAVGVDPLNVVIPDSDDPGFMADLEPPAGWTYASRVLEEALILDTPDSTTVLAIRTQEVSTWEMR
jgi:hypothetical protein